MKILGFLSAALCLLSSSDACAGGPMMGWSSWNTYRINISDTLIMRQADAMVATGLKDAGYTYVNIDDGFFGYRDSSGVIHTHRERFPWGMVPVTDYIHSRGLKAGIYSDAGSNTCGSIWDNDLHGVGVGMYGYEEQDSELYFNIWGFDHIKLDYCGAGQQLNLEERQRYETIISAIERVADKDVSVNVCRWAYPGTWVGDVAGSWRISPDIVPEWWSIKHIIQKNLYLSAFSGPGHYNDMDMLEIGRGLSEVEEETHFGMWCIMNSPLMIGCDLTSIPESSLSLLKNEELIAVNQDRLGIQAEVVAKDGQLYVLARDIVERHSSERVVALYNSSDEDGYFSVGLGLLGYGGSVDVRDLIRRSDDGICRDSLKYVVPAHGVKILRLSGDKRLERTVYEAEQAYLNCYNDLGKSDRPVAFMPMQGASGDMIVSNLGGSETNYAQWNDVFSYCGGLYRIEIHYVPAGKRDREINDRRIELSVNGEKYVLDDLVKDYAGKVECASVDVELNKGSNVLRIGSSLTWTPDIDCVVLKSLE